ncbi:hypothetical protein GCM10007989_20200 [Devosia pacifica]|uniref:Alkaline proteinase inhibitor/ Outer membrane lipoprotein Omp19 domain-containing protein n=1 Tax=Devosia pacifica TaxID=1335967 RepID=A0A918S4V4_9HYPH|nr:AprI/Inh family metalloprotease inhibitor [Devosia pacifica]GHA24492.1 hypothetical protein GCM10007989_20200 [Devosia pacifica]
MALWTRGMGGVAGLGLAVLLAACSSTSTRDLNVVGQVPTARPQAATPVQDSSVNQTQLPPLGGVQGQPEPSLSGQPVLGGAQQQQSQLGQPGTTGSSSVQTASADGSFVTLDPLATSANSGPEGVWTVATASGQCRLNLPLTARDGTTRYRASAPGCNVAGLANVGSWQQVGNQVQLFDQSNNMIAAMSQSGTGYQGTLAGGQSVMMQR